MGRHEKQGDKPRRSRHRRGLAALAVTGAVFVVAALIFAGEKEFFPGHQASRIRKTIVPDLSGDTLAVAFGELTSRGLCTGAIKVGEPAAGSGTEGGIVIDQHPSAGRKVTELTSVSLLVTPGDSTASPALSPGQLSAIEPACPSNAPGGRTSRT